MKRNKGFIFVLIILCASVSMAAFDKDVPASSTSLRNSNPEILANWSALETAIDQDHDFTTGSTQTGTHDQIRFTAPISTPSNVANVGFLYSKDVAAVVEFHWEDESGNELQMTSAGSLGSATTALLASTATFAGDLTLNAGFDLLLSTTSDITISGNTFTVAGATGNTVVAGTLDVTGNIDPTTYETTNGGFLDEDDLTSDSATKVASQQSIKAYVDAYIRLHDSKATTTEGGTFTSGDWRKRTVTEDIDVGGHVSVTSSVIVLDAGDYECRIVTPAFRVNSHASRLRNTTAGSTILIGSNNASDAATSGGSYSIIQGKFTIAATQNIEIQHRCNTTRSTNGFGAANSFGENEVYTVAEFWKR